FRWHLLNPDFLRRGGSLGGAGDRCEYWRGIHPGPPLSISRPRKWGTPLAVLRRSPCNSDRWTRTLQLRSAVNLQHLLHKFYFIARLSIEVYVVYRQEHEWRPRRLGSLLRAAAKRFVCPLNSALMPTRCWFGAMSEPVT